MTDREASDLTKWNARYADASLSTPAEPCWALRQHTRLLPLDGTALDLAAGLGGNARHLARCGLKTEAWDISDRAVDLINRYAHTFKLPLTARQVDLCRHPWPEEQFDVVTVSRWLDRNAFNAIRQRVRPGGRLFYQTFLAPVQPNAPQNPDYYLRSGELTRIFGDWTVETHGEGWLPDQDGEKRRYAWLVARKPL